MTRRNVASLLPVMLLTGMSPALAQESVARERRISFDARRVPLRKAAAALTRELGIPCKVDADVPDVELDLGFRNLKLETGVGLIIDAVREHNDHIIGYWSSTEVEPRTLRFSMDTEKVDLDFRGVPLRAAVRMVLEPIGQQYSFDSAVPDVLITLKLERVTYQKAMRLIIREAAKQVPGLTASKGG